MMCGFRGGSRDEIQFSLDNVAEQAFRAACRYWLSTALPEGKAQALYYKVYLVSNS